jgi:hypothetical protein
VNTSVDGDERDQVPKIVGENDGIGEFTASGWVNDKVYGPPASTPVALVVGVVESSRNPLAGARRVGAFAVSWAGVGEDADELIAVKTPPAAPRTTRTPTSPNRRWRTRDR